MISYLDQTPVFSHERHSDALQKTLTLAQKMDRLGCQRFWFSEHHGAPFFASAAPDVMIGKTAALTDRIQLGAGGILIRNHNPIQVAERFALLETLHPNRINLGIGMATGADPFGEQYLNSSTSEEGFNKLHTLSTMLNNQASNFRIAPYFSEQPPLWVLGKSPYMAQYAAERGLPYVHGSFIDMSDEEASFTAYRKSFQSDKGINPHLVLAIFALVYDTEEEAMIKVAPYKKWYAEVYHRRQYLPFSETEVALNTRLSDEEQRGLDLSGRLRFVGQSSAVLERVATIKKKYAIDEVMIISIAQSANDRLNTVKAFLNIP